MNKIIILFLLFSLVFLGCNRGVSEHKAQYLAKEFLRENVKFYVSENETPTTVSETDIILLQKERIGKEWYFYFSVQSNETGTIKKKGVTVKVDAKTGTVLSLDTFSLNTTI